MSSDPRQSGEAPAGPGDPDRPVELRGFPWLAIAVVFLLFAAYGTWRAPVPGVNEPHYLGKARHFWDPSWCRRDLFLESSNPHWVFYATVGALTRVCSLEQTAWVGRVLAWSSLAIGWVALARLVVPGRWGSIWSAALFLALSATGNLSGEWLIGGVESKAFAYGAVFLAVAAAGRNRLMQAAAWSGIAVSFHPVVGIWSAFGLMFAVAFDHLLPRTVNDGEEGPPAGRDARQRAAGFVGPALVGGLCSLPGLIPSLPLLFSGVPREVAQAADELQVFDRLDHHLDPMVFPARAWEIYGLLLAIWLVAAPQKPRALIGRVLLGFIVGTLVTLAFDRHLASIGFPIWAWEVGAVLLAIRVVSRPPAPCGRERRLFFGFVLGTLLIAACGAAVGFGPGWAGVLKFYPFRVADGFLPIAVAFAVARWLGSASNESRRMAPVLAHVICAAAFVRALAAPGDDRNPTGWSDKQRTDWIDVCRWVEGNTPQDALCLTPRYANFTFKWYAERAEYAIWKDCPQDAVSLLEWKRRLDLVRTWRGNHFDAGYTAEALDELRRETEIDYVVDWWNQPYRVESIYRNRSFGVYRLAPPISE